ncbi:MAG: tRNA (adenosine(37)-N6)-dimethylallyltransferase MiaA, partial [Eubacterium sp.]|nr:tRNA (adenosine(37)-N6)-dimethylallyltransferase MiaA [Eubacterium sp.]
NELAQIDAEAARDIHKNNKKRVVRALEIYYSTGKTKSMQNEASRLEETPYDVLYFVIGFKNRNTLYERINRRVDSMAENGLVEEARHCLDENAKTAAQAIGHKELKPYFNGEISLEEALDNLKKETRHYAKRQITWFKKRENAVWLYADEEDIFSSAVNKSKDFLSNE